MRQEMLFFNLATAVNGMPTPEMCLLPGQWRWTLLPGAQKRFSQWLWITQPSIWGGHCHWAIADIAKSLSPMP